LRARTAAVRDADDWGEEQELLRLQAILNDQAEKAEKMQWRWEVERAETRLATKAGAPDAAKAQPGHLFRRFGQLARTSSATLCDPIPQISTIASNPTTADRCATHGK
jgi:hypothetical protein